MTPTERQRIYNRMAFELKAAKSTIEFRDIQLLQKEDQIKEARNQAIQDCIDILVDDIKIPVTSSWLEKLESLKTKP